MDDPTLPLAGLSLVSGKRVDARFDGGMFSPDGGLMLLREGEQRLGVADRLAALLCKTLAKSWSSGVDTTILLHNTHLSMLLKEIGFADRDAIPWGIWGFDGRVLQADEPQIRQFRFD